MKITFYAETKEKLQKVVNDFRIRPGVFVNGCPDYDFDSLGAWKSEVYYDSINVIKEKLPRR